MDNKDNRNSILSGINEKQLRADGPIPQDTSEQSGAQEKKLYKLPTGPGHALVNKAISARDNPEIIPERSGKVNYNQKIEVKRHDSDSGVVITATSKTSKVTLEIGDIEKLAGYNKGVRKMLDFILIKANEQAFSDGELVHNYVKFPLGDLIEAGLYSTPQSARKGFKEAMSPITSLKWGGEIQKGKKTVKQVLAVLFPYIELKNSICTVGVNSLIPINWEFVAAYYTVMPRWCFRLNNNAYTLLQTIFCRARQNMRDIADRGYFTISMGVVHAALNLPEIDSTTHPMRDIIGAVEEAIDRIEGEALRNNDGDITITPINADIDTPIRDYLSKGYLKIGLKGRYGVFADLANKTGKMIEGRRKRSERIAEKAIIAAKAKSLEDGMRGEKED